MKSLVFLFLLTCISVPSSIWAHTFYFAYAEIEYNELNQKFEGTLIATSHDLEFVLMESIGLKTKLEKLDPSSEEVKKIESYLNKNLSITYGCSLDSNAVDGNCSANWEIESFRIQANGTIEIFFSAKSYSVYTPLLIDFRFLMEAFPEQQNKLTMLYRGKQETHEYTQLLTHQYYTLKP